MLKAFLRRVRAFFTAEVRADLAEIKARLDQRDELARQMEAALLTIALAGQAPQGESKASSDRA